MKASNETLFKFRDGLYEFWIIHFITNRPDFIMRCPEGQAPMISFEKIKTMKWEAYRDGQTRESLKLDTLEDPWEMAVRVSWLNPKQMVQVRRWVDACVKAGNVLGYENEILVDGKKIIWPDVQKNFEFPIDSGEQKS